MGITIFTLNNGICISKENIVKAIAQGNRPQHKQRQQKGYGMITTARPYHNLCCKARYFLDNNSISLFLDDWEIAFESISDLQWLGSGAQGAVFLGRLLQDQVAVKKVRDMKETDIRHLRKLNHPNIISFK